jgi:hypothetical protein
VTFLNFTDLAGAIITVDAEANKKVSAHSSKYTSSGYPKKMSREIILYLKKTAP